MEKSEKDYYSYINGILPNWVLHTIIGYSSDYPHFQKNWGIICGECKVEPQKLILVSEISFEKDSKSAVLCEYMTRKGYCVRRIDEFFPCKICDMALPCKEIWSLLKSKGFSVPEKWSDICSFH
jgi:hypothetical protein